MAQHQEIRAKISWGDRIAFLALLATVIVASATALVRSEGRITRLETIVIGQTKLIGQLQTNQSSIEHSLSNLTAATREVTVNQQNLAESIRILRDDVRENSRRINK